MIVHRHPAETPAAIFSARKRDFDAAVRRAMIDPTPENRALVDVALKELNIARTEVVREGRAIIAQATRTASV